MKFSGHFEADPVNGNYYYVSDEVHDGITWDIAEASCVKKGGHLPYRVYDREREYLPSKSIILQIIHTEGRIENINLCFTP